MPFWPGVPLSGTFRATGSFSPMYGMDPANGAWSVVLVDADYNVFSPTDGQLTYASISLYRYGLYRCARNGQLCIGVISQPIYQSDVYGFAEPGTSRQWD